MRLTLPERAVALLCCAVGGVIFAAWIVEGLDREAALRVQVHRVPFHHHGVQP